MFLSVNAEQYSTYSTVQSSTVQRCKGQISGNVGGRAGGERERVQVAAMTSRLL